MDNLEVESGKAILTLNPKIYPLDIIYSASYVFLDRAYILLDGEPESKVIVTLTPKNKENIEKIAGEFLNELINYCDHKKRAADTQKIREMILQRALLSNGAFQKGSDEEQELLDEIKDTPLPWVKKNDVFSK